MKKLLISFLLIFIFALPLFASAANLKDAFNTEDTNSILNKVAGNQGAGYNTAKKPAEIVGSIIQVALSLVGVIFLALMVYGGYLWMTDRGNSSQVEKAKGLISAAIIGLIIVLGAYAITYFVVNTIEQQTMTATGPSS